MGKTKTYEFDVKGFRLPIAESICDSKIKDVIGDYNQCEQLEKTIIRIEEKASKITTLIEDDDVFLHEMGVSKDECWKQLEKFRIL